MPRLTQKVTPCLWFDRNAEEAARFYVSVFGKNSKILGISHYTESTHLPKGTVLTVVFTLAGQEFTALNGGPLFPFTEAVSLTVTCKDQREVDYFWDKLRAGGGQEVQCGWLKDKYGLSWQIVPAIMQEYLDDPKKAAKVLPAMMKMVKMDVAALEKAAKAK